MLSVFPEILFLSPLAATIIRAALGLLFLYAAWGHSKRADMPSRALGIFELVIAGLLIAGAWTQPAAIAATIAAAIWYFQPTSRIYALSTILLAVAMGFSLLVTGPGALAFDWPL